MLLFFPKKSPVLRYRIVPGNPGAEKKNGRLAIVSLQLLAPELQLDVR